MTDAPPSSFPAPVAPPIPARAPVPAPRPPEVLGGEVRAAALLLGLGPEAARPLLAQLTEKEIRRLAQGARELRRAPPDTVTETLRQFVDAMERVGGDLIAGDSVLREMAEQVLGAEVARRTFGDPPLGDTPEESLGPIADANAEALAMVLVREQAQTVALVLSSLPPEKAATVMTYLPPAQRTEVVKRMASLDAVSPEVLREVRLALTQQLQSVVSQGMRKLDGRAGALEILRRAPASAQSEILGAIEVEDARLAGELRSKLFTFEDLGRLADRDLQQLLREIDSGQLAIALKGGSADVKTKFLKNMSSRAAEILGDDLAAMGPVKLSAVETAQAEIAKRAVELAESGKLTIVRPTDQML